MKIQRIINESFSKNTKTSTKATNLTKHSLSQLSKNIFLDEQPIYSDEYIADLITKGKSYNIQLAKQAINLSSQSLINSRIKVLESLVNEIDTLAKRAIELAIDWDYSSYNPDGLREKIESFVGLRLDPNLKTDDELKALLIEEYRSFNLPELNFDDISFVNLHKIVKPYKIAYEELDTWTCEEYDLWVLSKARGYNIPIVKKIFLTKDDWNQSDLFLKLRTQVEEMDKLEYEADDWGVKWDFTNYDPEGLKEAIKDKKEEIETERRLEQDGEIDGSYEDSVRFDYYTSRGC